MIEWSVSLGSILQIISMFGGDIMVLIAMRIDIRNIKEDLVDMKVELRKVGEILTNQAVTNHRLQALEEWRRTVDRP